jgi:histidinol phosphatase-like enzyme
MSLFNAYAIFNQIAVINNHFDKTEKPETATFEEWMDYYAPKLTSYLAISYALNDLNIHKDQRSKITSKLLDSWEKNGLYNKYTKANSFSSRIEILKDYINEKKT